MRAQSFANCASILASAFTLCCSSAAPGGRAAPSDSGAAGVGAGSASSVGGGASSAAAGTASYAGTSAVATGGASQMESLPSGGGGAGAGNAGMGAGGAPAAPADGVYSLHSVHSSKCMSVDGSQNGASLTQAVCADTATQHFALKALGDGSYSLINQGSGKAADIKDQSTAAGAVVQQWDFAQSPNQRFVVTGIASAAPARYEITAVSSSLALSVDGASAADGAAVVQEPWRAADEQLWTFEAATTAPVTGTTPPSTDLPGWTLTWSDEFNGADGSAADASKWNHDTGGSGWGNQELEYYTADTANSQQLGGNLVITATTAGANQYQCWNGTCQYTSARLLTSGKYSASYGRVEARVKMPAGKGLWPAFWMLGDNIASAPWPKCGEIDIMETVGSDVQTNHGSMHGPGYSGGSPLTATIQLPGAPKLSDDFHTYAVEWAPNSVKFFVDTTLYETRTPADIPAGTDWVYNHPFFILLNVAVGGQWPGTPDGTAHFPAQMLVDYVRVYAAK